MRLVSVHAWDLEMSVASVLYRCSPCGVVVDETSECSNHLFQVHGKHRDLSEKRGPKTHATQPAEGVSAKIR